MRKQNEGASHEPGRGPSTEFDCVGNPGLELPSLLNDGNYISVHKLPRVWHFVITA